MANSQWRLAYDSTQELLAALEPQLKGPRSRVTVTLSGGTDYVFMYMSTVNGVLYGISALNGCQVSVDPDNLTLSEH